MNIHFNKAEHKYYTPDGLHIPNVTSILKPISPYRFFDEQAMEKARKKGVAVHHMVEWECKGTLDLTTLPEWIKPAYDEWMKFKRHSQFIMLESELRVYNNIARYAGTLDLYGTIVIKGKKYYCYIDIKRSMLGGSTIGYQIAAYTEAHRSMMTPAPVTIPKRFALVIREDNDFRLQEFKDPKDYLNFQTCLNYQRLQEKHNAR